MQGESSFLDSSFLAVSCFLITEKGFLEIFQSILDYLVEEGVSEIFCFNQTKRNSKITKESDLEGWKLRW